MMNLRNVDLITKDINFVKTISTTKLHLCRDYTLSDKIKILWRDKSISERKQNNKDEAAKLWKNETKQGRKKKK